MNVCELVVAGVGSELETFKVSYRLSSEFTNFERAEAKEIKS
jgi:hypothetical protein